MSKLHLDACKTVTDKSGKEWLPASQAEGESAFDILEVGKGEACDYYEVLGYSEKRQAYWIEKIDFESLTSNLEQELEDYVERMGHG